MNDFDTVIISDTHLGAKNCSAVKLRAFLSTIRTKKLILNGDIFDGLNFNRLDGAHFHCLRLIRKMSPKVEVVWISGNHDRAAGVLSHIMGVEVRSSLKLSVGHKTYFVTHGDLFDEIIRNHPMLTWLSDVVYQVIQWFDRNHNIALYLKRKVKTFTRSYDKVMKRCVDLARKKKFDGVIIGHLHIPESKMINQTHYVNSGSWTQSSCTFIGIKDSKIELWDFDEFYKNFKNQEAKDSKILPMRDVLTA